MPLLNITLAACLCVCRQAMLAQMHLEQLASKRLEQMVTMSHIAREQSMLLPAASELLAGINSSRSSSQQQQPATAAAADPRRQQWQQTPPDAAQQQGSSRVRLPPPQQHQQQWQRPERSRLPSVLEQQGSLAQLLGDGPAVSVQGCQSGQCQQQSDSRLVFGPLAELEPAQEGPGQQSSGTAAVVIDIPGDHFTFLPLAAAAAASTSASWPAGREVLSGSSSSNSRLGDRQEDRVSRGGSSSSWWREWGGGEVPQGGLSEPLLPQQEVMPMLAGDAARSETAAEAGVCSVQAYQALQVATCPPTTAAYQCTNHQQQQQQSASAGSSRGHLPAAARQADTQPLLLERYLSSSDAGTPHGTPHNTPHDLSPDSPHDLSAATAAAAVAAASECSAGGAAPTGTLDSVHSQDSIGSGNSSSSTDCTASSEQPAHPTPHHQQQQRGPDRVSAAPAGDLTKVCAEAVPGRCSCDTSSNVDMSRKAPGQVVGGISLVQQQRF